MTTGMGDSEKRLVQLKKEVPARGLERYPSILKNLSDLPGELQSPVIRSLATSGSIQTIIAFPPQIHRGWSYVPKQALLFTPSGMIHLMASIWPDQEPRVTTVTGGGIMYMKITLLLLYGFLEIVARGVDLPTRLSMEFNTVAWECLSPSLIQFLLATRDTLATMTDKIPYSPTTQQALENLPLKFSNGVRIYGLLPGEELEDLVFQPGAWSTWMRWLLLFRRPITANTLLLLTSNYMVVMQEELHVAQGWIISYIPRSSIVDIQNRPRSQWNDITVQLQKGDQTAELIIPLKVEAVNAWRISWIKHYGHWQDLPGEVGEHPDA